MSNDILQNELKGSIAVTVESLMKDVAETLQSLYDEVSKETSNDELIRMILETQQKGFNASRERRFRNSFGTTDR